MIRRDLERDQGAVVLVTGAARRIGAAVARLLHASGCRIVMHCCRSVAEGEALCASLNQVRKGSASLLTADLSVSREVSRLAEDALGLWGRMDGLVNNASVFYPTPLGGIEEGVWDDLLGVNLKAPFFLSQALKEPLQRSGGAIVNIADVYGLRPLEAYPVYSIAKAGLLGLTQALALELAPSVRVNAVSPGAILWHEHPTAEADRRKVLERTPMGRLGDPEDIAKACKYLLLDAPYVTGQVLPVDGGRTLTL